MFPAVVAACLLATSVEPGVPRWFGVQNAYPGGGDRTFIAKTGVTFQVRYSGISYDEDNEILRYRGKKGKPVEYHTWVTGDGFPMGFATAEVLEMNFRTGVITADGRDISRPPVAGK